jgi:hypothetical protein
MSVVFLPATHFASASVEHQWHLDMVSWLAGPNKVQWPGPHLPAGDSSASLPCINPKRFHCPPLRPSGWREISGGTAITIKDCIHCIPVSVCSPLQVAVVRRPTYPVSAWLSVVYIYSLAIPVSSANLTNLIAQLPPPLILLGDFNAKNFLWGAALTDEGGRLVSDVCAGFDLIILNTGAHTHTHTPLPAVGNLVCPGPVVRGKQSILSGLSFQI